MAKTLGFSVSSSANLSQFAYLGFLSNSFAFVHVSKCPILRLPLNWAAKPSISVSCPEKVICRSSSTARVIDSEMDASPKPDFLGGAFPKPRVFASEARESSGEISWGLGATMLEDTVESENAKQGFRVANASTQIELESSVKGMKELMNGGVNAHEEAALSNVEKAWDHWNKLGAPKLIVAPMMDQSELPFRMLCRKYGATGAYTPMFHSRPFAFQAGYRRVEFTTCPVSLGAYVFYSSRYKRDVLLEDK